MQTRSVSGARTRMKLAFSIRFVLIPTSRFARKQRSMPLIWIESAAAGMTQRVHFPSACLIALTPEFAFLLASRSFASRYFGAVLRSLEPCL